MTLKKVGGYTKKHNGLHIETPLGLVNIWYGTNQKGQKVETLELMPNEFSGERQVKTTRGIKRIQFIQETEKQFESRIKRR